MFRFLKGHVLQELAAIPSDCVHCVVTSPPYWGLRRYGDWRMQVAWTKVLDFPAPRHPQKAFHHKQLLMMRAERQGIVWGRLRRNYICALGLEPTPEMFIEHMVQIFREVRRVLRPDGVCWLNLGDSYITKPNGSGSTHDPKYPGARCRREGLIANRTNNPGELGLKHKDLLLMPHRVALALQKDGWHVRMDIVWDKPNPMPESVTDRPTRSHEYLFQLTKSDQYFYDAEAIKEPVCASVKPNGPNSAMVKTHAADRGNSKPNPSRSHRSKSGNKERDYEGRLNHKADNIPWEGALRNKRSVWRIATEPFKGNHYATFPKKLVVPCILAGTSAWGCCPQCGTPWVRVLEKPRLEPEQYNGKYATEDNRARNLQRSIKAGRKAGGDHDNPFPQAKTIGWKQACDCPNCRPVPCTVLDPFLGSGTTAEVALELGRHAIGIDLWEGNAELINQRTNITLGLRLA